MNFNQSGNSKTEIEKLNKTGVCKVLCGVLHQTVFVNKALSASHKYLPYISSNTINCVLAVMKLVNWCAPANGIT